MLLALLAACSPEDVDLGPTLYGPDCAETFVPAEVCACEVAVDWAAVDPAHVDVSVLAEPATVVAAETCSGGVSPSSVDATWVVGVVDVGAGGETYDLRPYLGDSLAVVASDHDGAVVGWVIADVVEGGVDAVALE